MAVTKLLEKLNGIEFHGWVARKRPNLLRTKKKLEKTPILPFGGVIRMQGHCSLSLFLISKQFISKKNCCCQRKTTLLVVWQSLQNQPLTIKSTANFLLLFFFNLFICIWIGPTRGKGKKVKKKSRLRGADSYSIPKPHTRCPDKTRRAWYMQMTLKINIPDFYEATRQN